ACVLEAIFCAREGYGANYVSLSLRRQEPKIGTHVFELDSLPRYFNHSNEKPSDGHWILGNNRFEFFYPRVGRGNGTFLGKYTRKFRGEHSRWLCVFRVFNANYDEKGMGSKIIPFSEDIYPCYAAAWNL
ncbi:hypothetical protein AVEN_88912-1, partial [Araneus ventricosus]